MRPNGPVACIRCDRPTWNEDAVCIRTACQRALSAVALGGLDLEAGLGVRPRRGGMQDFPTNEVFKAGTLDEVVRHELATTDGTPEWRSWVDRAATRHHLAAVT